MTKKSVTVMICLILFSSFLSIIYILHSGSYVPAFVKNKTSRQVVIDPGHGGEDGGAVVDDVFEKDINLKIAKILKELLDVSGVQTIMTRTEDVSIYDEGADSLRKKKCSDLINRLKIANENENAIFVSIHQNKFPQTKYWGAQVFYGSENEHSKELAEQLQRTTVKMLQPNNRRNIKPVKDNVYLIYNAKTPAVLCECGFMSNKDEMALLKDESYQKKMAFSIYAGILKFYNS